MIFRAISIITVGQTYLEMLTTLYLTNVTPGDRMEPPADTKCPPAAQRKQAKRACSRITLQKNIPKLRNLANESDNVAWI